MDKLIGVGDTFTMAGRYKRRTLWQWLMRAPKELQVYKAIMEATSER